MMMQGQLDPAWQALERRGTSWLNIIGRLKSPAARAAVEARVSADYQNLLRADLAARRCLTPFARSCSPNV